MSDRTLLVFVKDPQPGRVKTRLVRALGEEAAADLYRALASGVLAATLPRAGEYERLVFYDPPEAGEAVRRWLPQGRLRRQAGGDLGARMAHAFDVAFARGARQVALVGSDAPSLCREDVLLAFDALVHADLVLGPAQDGGYYLVALRGPQPALFADVPWSTPRVLEETLARARGRALTVAQLERRRDVDTIDDVRSEWSRIEPLLRADPILSRRIAEAVAAA